MLRVNGGPTGSGTVIKKPKPESWWLCECKKMNRGYWVSCPDCHEKRP